jgi:hypothetical protein
MDQMRLKLVVEAAIRKALFYIIDAYVRSMYGP